MTPGASVIHNRAQILIQGEGFPNKHPVGSTSDYGAAGRTSTLMTLGPFEKHRTYLIMQIIMANRLAS